MNSQIFEEEMSFYETDKINNQYTLGFAAKIKIDNNYMLASSVSNTTFLYYRYVDIIKYLKERSYINLKIKFNNIKEPNMEIMKVYFGEMGEYYVVKKTFWLRIVQRCWKRIFAERQRQLTLRKQIANITLFELTGKNVCGFSGIKGMFWNKCIG